MADKNLRRIRRQFGVLERAVPPTRRITEPLLRNGMLWLRLPVALLLIAGGFLSFLPVLGMWMLPLGIMLLAIDVPPLRPAVATGSVWARRSLRRLIRRGRKL